MLLEAWVSSVRIDDSLSQKLMLICFVAAGILFWAWRQTPMPSTTLPKPKLQSSSISTVSSNLVSAATANRSRLVVDLSDRLVYVYRAGQIFTSYPVAIGQDGWQTPTGTFKVLQMYRNPAWRQPITGEIVPSGASNPLGTRWISFWLDERHQNQIGFHGTNNEQLVGEAVSHGCLRMRNQDIQAMYQQVTIGTSVIVRP